MLELISGNNKEQGKSNNIVLLRSQLTFLSRSELLAMERKEASERKEWKR
jgi:hypothetical protein